MMRAKYFLLVSLLAISYSLAAQDRSFGHFIGEVVTRWLDDNDGRKMELLQDFKYIDHLGVEWDAPKGWKVDGASIPQAAWSFVGGPFEGRYRNASVIHDVACDRKGRPWQDVHRAFYNAMLASGVTPLKAKTMYAAVLIGGPKWPRTVHLASVPITQSAAISRDLSISSMRLGEMAHVTIDPIQGRTLPCRNCVVAQRLPASMANVDVMYRPMPSASLSDEQMVKLETEIKSNDLSVDEIEKKYLGAVEP